MNELMERKELNLESISLAMATEWLETNKLGSYASSTVSLCHTRKYHGLFVKASNKATQRTVLLSKFDENLTIDESSFCLSHHFYQPAVHIPMEEQYQAKFDNELYPSSELKNKTFELNRSILMLDKKDTVLINYDFKKIKSTKASLSLKPLTAFRDFHHVLNENENVQFEFTEVENGVLITSSNSNEKLYIQANCALAINKVSQWYKNFWLTEEQKRGYPSIEDLFSCVEFVIDLNENKNFIISVSSEEQKTQDLNKSWQKEINNRKHTLTTIDKLSSIKNEAKSLLNRLEKARKDFIIEIAKDEYSILAGYHWFNSWGRDTFISAPGLLLNSNDENKFLKILKPYLALSKNGVLPNMTGASKDDSAYNCIDSSLWMFWALSKFKDKLTKAEIDKIWLDLKEIYLAYFFEKAPGVKMLDSGLLETGSPTDTMSWMDAMVDGKAASPRYGMLVEINALWYNANSLMHQLAKDCFDVDIEELTKRTLKKLKLNFVQTFWLEAEGYFADYVSKDGINKQLRPNQLFALAIDCIEVDDEKACRAILNITEDLITPFGLRTLSHKDSAFQARYEGDGKNRDTAYHNGTVWPWLIGAYSDAILRYSKDANKAKNNLKDLLLNFEIHLDEAGLNSISEVFDATEPFEARGCIAQAWSVSELRRALLNITK